MVKKGRSHTLAICWSLKGICLGKDDIYAVKFKEPLFGIKRKSHLRNKQRPFAFAVVKIIDENGVILQELQTDDKGDFQATITRGANVKRLQVKMLTKLLNNEQW